MPLQCSACSCCRGEEGLAKLGQEMGRKTKGFGQKRKEAAHKGRRKKKSRVGARSRLTWRSPEALEPSLLQKRDRIVAVFGNASGGSRPPRPLSAHPTCVRHLLGSPPPLSRFHLSFRCPGFAHAWKSPELRPCTPGAGYRLDGPGRDGESGLCVPGGTETDPPITINL